MTNLQRLSTRILATAIGIAAFAAAAHAQPQTNSAKEDDERGPFGYSWKDGETIFRFAAGTVTLSNRIQLLWADRRSDDRDADVSFDVPRARTTAAGWLGTEHVTYEIQFDWAEGPELQDLVLAWDASRTGAFEIQLGQFKAPFGRQRLTSSGSQQFVDRSIVSTEFTGGRDIGMQVKGLLRQRRWEYRVGVFNGAGQNILLDDDRGLQYNGRVMFQPFGEVKYSEGDLDYAEAPLLAIAGNVEINERRGLAAGDGRRRAIVATDVTFHYRGLSLLGELFLRTLPHEMEEAAVRSTGVLLQAGYLVVPRRLELAGRFATWDPTALVPSNDQREIGIAVGYFVNGHNLKLQSDVRRLDDRRRAHSAYELRAQLQVIF